MSHIFLSSIDSLRRNYLHPWTVSLLFVWGLRISKAIVLIHWEDSSVNEHPGVSLRMINNNKPISKHLVLR